MKQLHSIPIGGGEPEHETSENCWCSPFKNSIDFYQHHAKDCREKFERQNIFKPGNQWMLIEIEVGHKHSECSCYGAKPGHSVGVKGCVYGIVPDPILAPNCGEEEMWDTQIAGVVQRENLEKVFGYTQLKCGCWKALRSARNSNVV